MAKFPSTGSFMITVLIIETALGCGVMPSGQSSTQSFTVSGFSLPVSMVYSGVANVQTEVHGIATSRDAAKAFVERLVMQAILDILEQQGRSALLPDAITSSILDQLRVQINYDPMECKGATVVAGGPKQIMGAVGMTPHCIIVGSTVTGTCPSINNLRLNCGMTNLPRMLMPISGNQKTIAGTLVTTNIIMANWSKSMWQNVLNRALRLSAVRPFGLHFVTAFATVN
ncbi:hypothetical protein KIN20_031073 [Parelaphostrongylus tenuis]|uniref:Uncharacterized protein n=1 Tax=Parelaphostrongylus tenuis TaxID=148309 RepID=A0AAD5R6B9_PARTN|nr:hypothetical protein KIN20_031073 [Parelaphostrongylus tenuis]